MRTLRWCLSEAFQSRLQVCQFKLSSPYLVHVKAIAVFIRHVKAIAYLVHVKAIAVSHTLVMHTTQLLG